MKGIALNTASNDPDINIFHVNPANIANNKCPAVIFAASRTPNVIAFVLYDINSIGTISGAIPIGVPAGINIAKKSNLCFINPIIVHPNHILTLIPNATIMCAVGVNVYGTIPTMFIVANNKNIVNTNGKYFAPSVPIFSFTTPLINSYIISNNDCHLPGTIFPSILCNPTIINTAININNPEFVNDKSRFPNGCIGIIRNIENCSNVEYNISFFCPFSPFR